jgi:REP element-mobilizing transposase RayT
MIMTRPRSELICIEDTPYYHLTSRCVRRTFLCGFDKETGKDYEHRKGWIENRIRILSSLFGIDICSYAVMSNHIHIVCQLCPEQIKVLPDKEVVFRWRSLYQGSLLVQKWAKGEAIIESEQSHLDKAISEYRERLSSISWFMKCLNEPVARQANLEDGCTGHFWEARYKSQALLSEEAVLSCMAYVDLNPIRAKMTTTPENSDHTSIKERINPIFQLGNAIDEQKELKALRYFKTPLKPLAQFEGAFKNRHQRGILFSLKDYLELVDYTGRAIVHNKRGSIPLNLPPILERLCIDRNTWLQISTQFELCYRSKYLFQKTELANTG